MFQNIPNYKQKHQFQLINGDNFKSRLNISELNEYQNELSRR